MQGKRIVVPNRFNIDMEDFTVDESSIGGDDLLIKTHYSLISPGTELSIYTALEKNVHKEGSWCQYPFHPGYISVGEVCVKGERVRSFDRGDLVFCYGNHASLNRVNAARDICVRVPENVDPMHALFCRFATIAMTALRKAEPWLGQTACVIGLGLVGNMAAQLFKMSGAKVIGIDLFSKRLEIAASCGLEFGVNASTSDVIENVRDLTGGSGVEIVVESIGKPDLIKTAIAITARNGQIILLGSPRGEWQTDATEILSEIHMKGLAVKGALEWSYPIKHTTDHAHSIERNTRIAMSLIGEEKLKVAPLLTHVVKPDRFKSAYEGLLNRKDDYLGVVIDWQEV